ncbi:MAG TPA: tryptophan 2,3-dioxygenase family protein [Vicinamibacterales bacterium]|nr:tryptophan 2,3-dioxygenase family protein [Vicinamibacterales bacterium]
MTTKPILPGQAPSDYERYLRTDELLSLQKTPEDAVHRDEHLFQIVHQSSELWLKLACLEIEAATALLDADAVAAAVRLLRRANDAMQLIVGQLHMLEHMNPADYAIVRTALGHGAGFDSPGFRRIHQLSPALGQGFDALLARRRLAVGDIYRNDAAQEDLYQLAEQLLTWDERNILWRMHHLKVVERIIGGHVIGTQGTPVEVLGKRLDLRFFPELWAVRDQITRESPLGADGHGSR